MELQSTPFTCGPCSVMNALSALGLYTTQEAVTELSKATTAGTNASQLRRAIQKLGCTPEPVRAASESDAWGLLVGALYQGSPVILSVDRDAHWVCAVGVLGARVAVVDSSDGELCLTYDRTGMLERWRGRDARRAFYGIAVRVSGG